MALFHTSAHYYRFFANECRRGGSPLYERLSLGIADCPSIQSLAARRRKGQPPANLIFGAVHYLLLDGVDHPLKEYYPSVGGTRAVDDDAFRLFAEFCRAHQAVLIETISSRATNTNEVGRSALLAPAFDIVAREADAPLGLVEIGASAGLNLNMDRYGYRYTDALGAPRLERPNGAGLVISCVLEGERMPSLAPRPPAVGSRVGLELHPIDVSDANDRRWLKALVWPERMDRLAKLAAALDVAAAFPPRITAGDAVTNLASALAEIPSEQARCVYHTVMSYQLNGEQFKRIEHDLLEASTDAPIWRLSVEGEVSTVNPTATFNPLRLARYRNGKRSSDMLAVCDPHGLALEWTAACG